MDWAAMVMQMYKSWAQGRGYKVTVVEEMPGEIAGIKVLLLTIIHECETIYKQLYHDCIDVSRQILK